MKILPQLLQRQVLVRTLGIFFLGNLMLLTNQLFLTFNEILSGDLPLRFLWNTSMLFLIFKSGFLLTSCYLLALLFFMANLYDKNEIYIMKNMGIGEGSLFAWLSLPSLFVAAMVGALVFYLSPISIAAIDRIYANGLVHQFQDIQEGNFDFSDSNSFRVRDDNLEVWSIYADRTTYAVGKLDEDKRPHWDAGRFNIPINQGRLLNWAEDGSVVDTKFTSAEIGLNYVKQLTSSVQSSSSWELIHDELSATNRNTKDGIRRRVEIYERTAIFISSLLVLPLVLVSSRRQVRSKAAKNVFLGLLVYFGYLILIFSSIGSIRGGGTALYFWLINAGSVITLLSMLLSPYINQIMHRSQQLKNV